MGVTHKPFTPSVVILNVAVKKLDVVMPRVMLPSVAASNKAVCHVTSFHHIDYLSHFLETFGRKKSLKKLFWDLKKTLQRPITDGLRRNVNCSIRVSWS
jgi:hypothetical protein